MANQNDWRQVSPPLGMGGSRRGAVAGFVISLLLTAVTLAQTEPPKPGTAGKAESARTPRLDAEGVPLPDGAIARLGSARFRFPSGTGGPIVFSPDGKLLAFRSPIIYSPDGKQLGPRSGGVMVFEVATGRLVHRPPGSGRPLRVHVLRFLDDGKRIAVGSVTERGYPVDVLHPRRREADRVARLVGTAGQARHRCDPGRVAGPLGGVGQAGLHVGPEGRPRTLVVRAPPGGSILPAHARRQVVRRGCVSPVRVARRGHRKGGGQVPRPGPAIHRPATGPAVSGRTGGSHPR